MAENSSLGIQRFSPFSSSPQAKPYYNIIEQQCAYNSKQIKSEQIKVLHQIFPRMLSAIFGFNGYCGWSLRTCSSKRNPRDFNAARMFLAVGGDMFQLIEKLDQEHFKYTFPMKCLPPSSQDAIAQGNLPSFYQSKLSAVASMSLEHVELSAFEYYFFSFAYYLINQLHNHSKWVPLQDCLYHELFNSYLYYFLPPSGIIPDPLPSSLANSPTQQGTTHVYPSSATRPNYSRGRSPSYHVPLGLLKMNGTSQRRCLYSSTVNNHAAIQSSTVSYPSITFIEVFIEFWLNQLVLDTPHGSFTTKSQSNLCCQEYIRFLRMFVKHILYFTNGSTVIASATPTQSHFTTPQSAYTDNLRSSIVHYVQKDVYKLLRHAFQHWPLDDNFRYVLELWLSYIQPWRYTDPAKPSSENKESLEKMPLKWRNYVMDNYPFYTVLFVTFLDRCFQLNLTSDIGITLLFRVFKVFTQTGLKECIAKGEYILLHSYSNHTHQSPNHSPIDHTSLKALLVSLEGQSQEHQPLFSDQTIEAVKVLISNVQQSYCFIDNQMKQTNASEESDSKSWFSWLWDNLFDDRVSTLFKAPPDPSKLKGSLQEIDKNIRNFFELPSDGALPILQSESILDGSPMLRSTLPPSHSSTVLGSTPHSQMATPPSSIEAEYYNGTCQLTPHGKEQIIRGHRLCSKLRVMPLGDPVLSPICSYENATLVRLLYKLSCYLNEKFATQLQNISNSHNILYKLLLQLLTPPHQDHTLPPPTNEPPATPIGSGRPVPVFPVLANQPHRINLRVFASYYTILYIFLLIAIVWLLGLPLWLLVLIAMVLITFYCILKYLLKSK